MFKVDIVTVTKDDYHGLKKTLDSIFRQTFVNFNLIVINGMSYGPSVHYLNKINDNRLCIVSGEDNGIFFAMNKGLKICKNDFVMFLNSGDDFANDNSLLNLMKHVKNPNYGYYATSILCKSDTSCRLRPDPLSFDVNWLSKNLPSHSSILFPKCFYLRNQYNTNYKYSSDTEYKYRLIANCIVLYIPVELSIFYYGGLSTDDRPYNLYLRYKERFLIKSIFYEGFIIKATNLARLTASYLYKIFSYFIKN